MHEGHEPGGDGQAHGQTAVLGAGSAGLGEGEWLEDERLLLVRDADAGVANVEAEEHVIGRTRFDADVQRDRAAGRGELDGVAEEVAEDLVQVVAIAGEVVRDVVRDVEREGERLALDIRGHHVHEHCQAVAEVEGNGLAGLDAGEIEGVADDAHELRGRGPGDGEIVMLLLVEGGAGEELDHADDAVHGRAQLVVDVGEELALGAVSALGLVLAELEGAEEARVLDGDGGLGGEQLHDLDAGWREDVIDPVVLEIDDADQRAVTRDGRAQERARPVRAHVWILGKGLVRAGVLEDQARLRAGDVAHHGVGEPDVRIQGQRGQGAKGAGVDVAPASTVRAPSRTSKR